MRRPVIVTQAVGMQERGNIDLVLNHELGAFCPTIDRIIPAVAELMNPETYAATAARLANAVPRDGAVQIANLLLEQIQLGPLRPRRRIRLPSIADLRQISAQRLRRLNERRLRLPRLRAKADPKRNKPARRFPGARRFAPWRRTRRE